MVAIIDLWLRVIEGTLVAWLLACSNDVIRIVILDVEAMIVAVVGKCY